MDTPQIVAICIAALLGVGWIMGTIRDLIREGRENRLAVARANADREEAITRGKEADATAEGQRTEQARLDAAERAELVELGQLRERASHVTTISSCSLSRSKA